MRILIVDDDRNMAKTLADIMKLSNYEAETAHSGQDALNQLMPGRFDCVLTDIRMPEMDGVELNRAAQAREPHLPVFLMTAYSSDDLVQTGLDEGARGVLTKPVNIANLFSLLEELQRRRTR